MDDDLNTAAALAGLFTVSAAVNRYWADGPADVTGRDAVAFARYSIIQQMETLGLRARETGTGSSQADAPADDIAAPLLKIVLDIRSQARASKQFAIADSIRDALNAAGLKIEDGPDGQPIVKRAAAR